MSTLIRKASLRRSLRRRPRRMSFTKEVFIHDAILDGNVEELRPIFFHPDNQVENGAAAAQSRKSTPDCEDGVCDVDMQLTGGKTPLHLAVDAGRLNVVKFLVDECRANVNCADNSGWSPLHRAVGTGRVEIAHYLLDNGADPCKRSPDTSLPLSLALDRGDNEMVALLTRYERQTARKSGDRHFYNTLAMLTERQMRKAEPTSPTHVRVKSPTRGGVTSPASTTSVEPVRRITTVPKIAVRVWPVGDSSRKRPECESSPDENGEATPSYLPLASGSSKRRANSDSKGRSGRTSSVSCPPSPGDSPTRQRPESPSSPDGGSRLVVDYFKRSTSQRRSVRETLASLAGRRKVSHSSVWRTVSPAASPNRANSPK